MNQPTYILRTFMWYKYLNRKFKFADNFENRNFKLKIYMIWYNNKRKILEIEWFYNAIKSTKSKFIKQ